MTLSLPAADNSACAASTPSVPRDRPPAFTASLNFPHQREAEADAEEIELLPLYAPSAPAARPKRTAPHYSLGHTLRQCWLVLPVVAAAHVLLATQVGIKYGLTKAELQGTRASLKKVDKRGYTLAMRVAWLEEATKFANGTALRAASTLADVPDLNRLEWRRPAELVATAAVLSARVVELDKNVSECRQIQVLHGGSDERKEAVFGGGGS